jgi:hypothetical protein
MVLGGRDRYEGWGRKGRGRRGVFFFFKFVMRRKV